MILLLAIYLRDDFYDVLLLESQHILHIVMLSTDLSDFLQYLSQQLCQTADNLTLLRFVMLALLHICQIRFLYIKELRSRAMDAKTLARSTHY